MRPLVPHVKKDLIEMSHRVEEGHRGAHVHVRGVMQAGRHVLPFGYSVHEDETFDHAARIEEHHARGLAYAKKVDELDVWRGATETIGKAGIKITCCTAGMGGHGHWGWYCSWDETLAGETKHHSVEGYAEHPDQLLPLEEIKAKVREDASKRSHITERGQHAHRRALAALSP